MIFAIFCYVIKHREEDDFERERESNNMFFYVICYIYVVFLIIIFSKMTRVSPQMDDVF